MRPSSSPRWAVAEVTSAQPAGDAPGRGPTAAHGTETAPLVLDDLLAGPRGRRVCLEIAFQVLEVWQVPWRCDDDPRLMSGRLAEILGALTLVAATPDQIAERAHERETGRPPLAPDEEAPGRSRATGTVPLDLSVESVSLALTASVDAARYWEPPDEWDLALALPVGREALRQVAELLVASPATRWWTAPVDTEDLHEVEMLDDEVPSARSPLTGVDRRLAAWRAAQDEAEARHIGSDRGARHAIGGDWWSPPLSARPVVTSAVVPSLGPSGLSTTEDSFGWDRARTWPLRTEHPVEVYEIDGPDDLARLVARFPLDVSRSRRSCWWEATGVDTAWWMPDWEGASHHLDAVHLTVRGYLLTAGRAVPVPGGAIRGTSTVLAGWAPGETLWLTDALSPDGPQTLWQRRPDEVLWDPVAPGTPVTHETAQGFDTPPPHN